MCLPENKRQTREYQLKRTVGTGRVIKSVSGKTSCVPRGLVEIPRTDCDEKTTRKTSKHFFATGLVG